MNIYNLADQLLCKSTHSHYDYLPKLQHDRELLMMTPKESGKWHSGNLPRGGGLFAPYGAVRGACVRGDEVLIWEQTISI